MSENNEKHLKELVEEARQKAEESNSDDQKAYWNGYVSGLENANKAYESKLDEPLERYKYITSQMRFFAERMVDHFKLYIQLASAVVGGYLWLRIQKSVGTTIEQVKSVAPALLLFIGLATVLLILSDLDAWHGYRKAEFKLMHGVPKPNWTKYLRQEVVTIGFILVTSILGALYMLFS